MAGPLHTQRDRADSFGSVARAYDRHRPRYPAEVIDDIAALAHGGRVLDVGSGTGIAAAQLAERDLPVLSVEPDAAMAAVAAGKGLRVELGTFEDWDPDGRVFDVVLFAQSWHWVRADVAVPKAYLILRPGGSLALLWHATAPESPPQADFDAVYRRYMDLRTHPTAGDDVPLADTLAAAGLTVSETTHPVRIEYTTQAWLDMVFTFSAQIVLAPDAAQSLRADLADLVGPDGVTVVGSTYMAAGTKPR